MKVKSKQKPPKRRRYVVGEKHGDATHDALIQAFVGLLEGGQGFHDITIADITEASELTRSGFYFYFANKGQVLAAAAEGVRLEMMQAVQPFITGTDVDAFHQNLEDAMRSVAQQWSKRRVLLHAMIEAAVSDRFIDEVWTDWYMSFRDPVCTRVQAHVEALGGTVDEARLTRIVTALLWTNERNLYRAHPGPQASKGSSAQVAETLAELWSSSLDHIVMDSLPAKNSRA